MSSPSYQTTLGWRELVAQPRVALVMGAAAFISLVSLAVVAMETLMVYRLYETNTAATARAAVAEEQYAAIVETRQEVAVLVQETLDLNDEMARQLQRCASLVTVLEHEAELLQTELKVSRVSHARCVDEKLENHLRRISRP